MRLERDMVSMLSICYAALAMSISFKVDLEDFHFVLFDELRADERLRSAAEYADLDRDVWEATLEEGARIAREVLHPINASSDREGCHFDGAGNVRTPRGFREAWKQLADGGWVAPSSPADLGGGGMPAPLNMALHDMFIGACASFMMYPGLTAAAGNSVAQFAPEKLRESYARKLFEGQWAGTMCLTEAGAGSAVGECRCKATPTEDEGVYDLEGEKLFISGADQDLTENIVHLVLARTPGSPAGTKGLSLFLVPKFLVGDDLRSGERNGATVVGIEHKMGIHGSATCTLALGSDRPCKGWLIGSERDGIALMFHMMNEARLAVAGQGAAMASAAYNYAVQYARERIQGTAVSAAGDSAPVAIVEHPDIRRMLMTMKVRAETMRSAMLGAALDLSLAEHGADAKERERAKGRVDLMMPVLKAHFSDVGYEMATMGIQVLGGYGYVSEFPLEQLARDAKIQSIYEGTNGIQALDLLGRKMRAKGGALFKEWIAAALGTVGQAQAAGLDKQAEAVGKAVSYLGASAQHLGKIGAEGRIEDAVLHATPFLEMFGLVLLGVVALNQARVAKSLIAERGDHPRLRGKLLNLDFYVSSLLPRAHAIGKSIQSGDVTPLDPSLFA